MTDVLINKLWLKNEKKLDGAIKAKAMDFMSKLANNPDNPGLDLKPPKGAVDKHIRTARVTDFWRAVLLALPKKAGFAMIAVLPHDDAYDYASRLRVAVNEATGALEVIDQLAIDLAAEGRFVGAELPGGEAFASRRQGGGAGAGPASIPAATATAVGSPVPVVADAAVVPSDPILRGYEVADLQRFGVDPDVAAKALAMTDASVFEQLCEVLPELQGCALLDLQSGKHIDAVYLDLVGEEVPQDIDPHDIIAALSRPATQLSFAAGSPDELVAAMSGDMAAWRVWLHPMQRRLAYHDGWNGPFRVTGGAGTGKTVTALHRARHLAERELAAEADQPSVLLATFTKNLASALQSQLLELGGETMNTAVDVVNLDALSARILKTQQGKKFRLVGQESTEVRQAWEMAAAGTAWTPEFLNAEWLHVVLAQGIVDQAGYLTASRKGRGTALNRIKRVDVWKAIERAQQSLAVDGVMTFTQAASKAADIAAVDQFWRYPHAIIDEAQDLHPAHWRLVRALVPEGPDDIFLVGDAHQRIYGQPLVLSRYGIRTQGRSRRLTINYRTSEQILRWCVGVMTGVSVDDLEGEGDDLVGARSEFTGPEPLFVRADGPADEDAKLADVVGSWLAQGYQPADIGVLVATVKRVEETVDLLKASGIGAVKVERFDRAPEPDAVQVMTMHRAKGLEFTCVAITRLGAGDFPPAWAMQGDADAQTAALQRERALLYVAGSRAREQLALLYAGKPSKLLGG